MTILRDPLRLKLAIAFVPSLLALSNIGVAERVFAQGSWSSQSVREFAENVVTLREGQIVSGFMPALSQGPTAVEMLQ